jgi:hypothetical protein
VKALSIALFTLASSCSVLAIGCSKPGAPNAEVYATDNGKSTDALGHELYAALRTQDANAVLKLTAPPTLVKCERNSVAGFATAWNDKHKGVFQSVGAPSDITKVAAGSAHKYSRCTAVKDVTFGQVLVYSDPSAKDKPAPFSPFWIVKEGNDPSATTGWYLADPF